MIKTVHEVGSDHVVERRRKRTRLTSTNGRRVRGVFGEQPLKDLTFLRWLMITISI